MRAPTTDANLAVASQGTHPQGEAAVHNQRLDRIDAVVFNNDRTALIAVQGWLQDPASRVTALSVAQAQQLSMAEAGKTLEQGAYQRQAQQPQQQGPTEPALSTAQGLQAQSPPSPRLASL